MKQLIERLENISWESRHHMTFEEEECLHDAAVAIEELQIELQAMRNVANGFKTDMLYLLDHPSLERIAEMRKKYLEE